MTDQEKFAEAVRLLKEGFAMLDKGRDMLDSIPGVRSFWVSDMDALTLYPKERHEFEVYLINGLQLVSEFTNEYISSDGEHAGRVKYEGISFGQQRLPTNDVRFA